MIKEQSCVEIVVVKEGKSPETALKVLEAFSNQCTSG